MIPPVELPAVLGAATAHTAQVALVCGALWLAGLLLQGVLLHRRQRQALQLAPAVYAAGGDPAAVLRAVSPQGAEPPADGPDGP